MLALASVGRTLCRSCLHQTISINYTMQAPQPQPRLTARNLGPRQSPCRCSWSTAQRCALTQLVGQRTARRAGAF